MSSKFQPLSIPIFNGDVASANQWLAYQREQEFLCHYPVSSLRVVFRTCGLPLTQFAEILHERTRVLKRTSKQTIRNKEKREEVALSGEVDWLNQQKQNLLREKVELQNEIRYYELKSGMVTPVF